MKVFIGVPNTGTVVRGLAMSLCQWVQNKNIEVVVYLSTYDKPMQFNRNHIVKTFLQTDADKLWWIDDDIVPPPDALEKMVEHNVDAVTGIAFCTRPNDEGLIAPYPVTMKKDENGGFRIHFPEKFEEIDACGGGCVMVDRKVYECQGMGIPYMHTMTTDGLIGMTCDFNVWSKAKSFGFELWVDPTIVCSHLRELDLAQFNRTMVRVAEKYNG